MPEQKIKVSACTVCGQAFHASWTKESLQALGEKMNTEQLCLLHGVWAYAEEGHPYNRDVNYMAGCAYPRGWKTRG